MPTVIELTAADRAIAGVVAGRMEKQFALAARKSSPFPFTHEAAADRRRGILAEIAVARALEIPYVPAGRGLGNDHGVDLATGEGTISIKCPKAAGRQYIVAPSADMPDPTVNLDATRRAQAANWYVLVWPREPLVFEIVGYLGRESFCKALELEYIERADQLVCWCRAEHFAPIEELAELVHRPPLPPPPAGRIDISAMRREYTSERPNVPSRDDGHRAPPIVVKEQPNCNGLRHKCRNCQNADQRASHPALMCAVCGLSTGSPLLSMCARCADADTLHKPYPRELSPEMNDRIQSYYATQSERLAQLSRRPAMDYDELGGRGWKEHQRRAAHPRFGDTEPVEPGPSFRPFADEVAQQTERDAQTDDTDAAGRAARV